MQHIIVGTAGHIDHGKTSLVRQLTGIDTDRLPEEKQRGISIDLGFAHWESDGCAFGLVDVPGHERFIKNMVAGVTGIDLCLLVIAADDGVMPQTREHLEIMDLLGVRAGLVVVTKTDLVSREYVDLVREEISELTLGTFLDGSPVVPVSCLNGTGIPELKLAIQQLARQMTWPSRDDLFRMPIDRVFSIAGHGTVVTGTVMRGTIHKGDVVDLWRIGCAEPAEVRIRGVQNHGLDHEESGSRQRTAINLAGIKLQDVQRGDELSSPGFTKPSRRMLVRLRVLKSAPISIKDRMPLQLHLATRETPVRLRVAGGRLAPGEIAYAELRLPEAVIAEYGQRFILRRRSPARTIAGGVILDPALEPRRRIKDLSAYGTLRDNPDELQRLSQFLAGCDVVDSSPLTAAWRCGIALDTYARRVQELLQRGELLKVTSSPTLLIHRDRFQTVMTAMLRRISQEIARRQPRRTIPVRDIRAACAEIAPPAVLEAAQSHLLQSGKLIRIGTNLGLSEGRAKLTKQQSATLANLLEAITQAGLAPPTAKELAVSLQQPPKQLQELLSLCVEDNVLCRIGEGLYLTAEALDEAQTRCCRLLEQAGNVTVSQLAGAWNVSRKYAIPLAEYFDACQVTARQGDLRQRGPKFVVPPPLTASVPTPGESA
ncbi:MAG: selenocysteine-specific translation elongation factor [Planctomycetes bacterium]|nr:selenocysteine-specific translation elongation factor [Planctomycetota bacterium]